MEVPDNIFQLVNHLYMTLGSFGENFKSLCLFTMFFDLQESTRPSSQEVGVLEDRLDLGKYIG